MSVITLRGLSPEAEKMIRRRSTRKGKSMNRFLLEIIESEVLGDKSGKPREYDDLDDLIGRLTSEDAEMIDESLKEQRKIDSELWKWEH